MEKISIKRGDTLRAVFTYTQDGSPVDLTGAVARLDIRKGKSTAAVTAGSDSGELVITPSTGVITMTIPAVITAEIKPDTYLTDMEITFADGVVMSTPDIQVTVTQDVTYD